MEISSSQTLPQINKESINHFLVTNNEDSYDLLSQILENFTNSMENEIEENGLIITPSSITANYLNFEKFSLEDLKRLEFAYPTDFPQLISLVLQLPYNLINQSNLSYLIVVNYLEFTSEGSELVKFYDLISSTSEEYEKVNNKKLTIILITSINPSYSIDELNNLLNLFKLIN